MSTTPTPPLVGATPDQREYYEHDVDFNDLAKCDPDFAQLSKNAQASGWFDFQDPQVVQQLTRSLLKHDFNLTINLSPDRLCPPVPVRWNYIRWIQALLDTTPPTYTDVYDPARPVHGLDIGVGASCIYALLACSTSPAWRMAGTDVDEHSLAYARRNVDANGLGERVRLTRVQPEGPLVALDAVGVARADFVMTNPPFYASRADFEDAYRGRSGGGRAPWKAPSAVTAWAENEMICEGGDVGFVGRMVEESLVLRGRVRWYTAMLSKLSSLQQIVAKLKECGIGNYAVTSLHPGNRTKRWAVAWSFGDLRPRNDVARHGELVLNVLPPATANTVAVPMQDATWAGKVVDETMNGLDVQWHWKAILSVGVMQCKENVWSRAARRKKRFGTPHAPVESSTVEDDSESDEEEIVGLAVKIVCKEEEVDIRWLRGHDYLLFESFCGMLKRALVVPKK